MPVYTAVGDGVKDLDSLPLGKSCRERCFDRGENGMMNEKQDMAQFQDSLFHK
jgi:hypothetical protein